MSKKFSIIALIFALYVTVASTATAFAASDPIMMYGKTTPVLTNGINNAGNIWFQNDGATVYLANDANQQPKLVPDPSNPGGYKIEGWAWSDNLGWVSFSCRGGKNPPTTGAACGNFDYGVTIDATGTFHGYAWNDAMGYINMNSETYSPPALDGLGKPIVHAVKMTTTGAISGYAWSQSLGWLNFSGAYARIKIKIPASVNTLADCPTSNPAGLCGCVGPDPSSLHPDSFFSDLEPYPANGVRVADGVDAYTVGLYFHDQNGNPIPRSEFDNGHYEAKIIFKWEDTIKRNQTTSSSNAVGLGDQSILNKISKPFNNSAKGAVTYKPVLLYTPNGANLDVDDTYETGIVDGSNDLLSKWPADSEKAEFKITSVAPTTDGNLSKITSSTKGFVENENFSTFKNPPASGLERNGLKLVSIDWTIKDTTPGGAMITGTSYFDSSHGTLKYKPALAIKTLNGGNDKDTLWMYRNVPVGVEMEGVDNKTDKIDQKIINTGLDSTFAEFIVDNKSEFEVGFTKSSLNELKDPQNQKIDSTSTMDSIRVVSENVFENLPFQLEATIPVDTIGNADKTLLPGNYAEGAGLYSKITYKAISGKMQDITYFSNHLPRTISTAVSNPAVVIQGTTYSQGNEVTSVQEGVNITGIGDQNVNIVRDLVFENIQKLLMGQELPDHVKVINISSLNPQCLAKNGCLEIQAGEERIFYFNANNVVINNNDPITDIEPIDKNTVIIVDGGDIHIESNLYTTSTEKKIFKTGIVALRKNSLGQGNIYIGPNVTNIQALMIADGTLFSAPNFGAEGFLTTTFGEPQDNMNPAIFNKQLIIEGGVSSRNCIGCVDNAKKSYFLPTGPLSKTDENKEIAKKYDLNYLRYFSLQLEYDPMTGDPKDQKCGKFLTSEENQLINDGNPVTGLGGKTCDGIDPTQIYDSTKVKSGDLISNPTLKAKGAENKTNPVYIKYVPPSPDSFVFSKEKSLTF